MSKNVDTQVEKTQSLIAGVRKNLGELRQYGYSEDQMVALETEIKKLKTLSDELEELRRQATEKCHLVNALLVEAKEHYIERKQPIKLNIPNYQWLAYGIPDKQ